MATTATTQQQHNINNSSSSRNSRLPSPCLTWESRFLVSFERDGAGQVQLFWSGFLRKSLLQQVSDARSTYWLVGLKGIAISVFTIAYIAYYSSDDNFQIARNKLRVHFNSGPFRMTFFTQSTAGVLILVALFPPYYSSLLYIIT